MAEDHSNAMTLDSINAKALYIWVDIKLWKAIMNDELTDEQMYVALGSDQ